MNQDYAELIEWLRQAVRQSWELPTQEDFRRQDVRSMAADAIALLIAERDALREAMKPFGEWKIPETFEEWPSHAQVVMTVTASDLRRARAALK